jgi:hypothetical protein
MIGIISDTHDNIPNILKAVEIFKKNNVDYVVHCGDIVAPGTVRFFNGLKMKFIFGNCDGDRTLIEERVKQFGWEHLGMSFEVFLGEKKICFFHGHRRDIQEKILNAGYDYYIHGHTHEPEDRMHNKTRVLCPGGFYLGDPASFSKIILLDAEKDNVTFIDVN